MRTDLICRHTHWRRAIISSTVDVGVGVRVLSQELRTSPPASRSRNHRHDKYFVFSLREHEFLHVWFSRADMRCCFFFFFLSAAVYTTDTWKCFLMLSIAVLSGIFKLGFVAITSTPRVTGMEGSGKKKRCTDDRREKLGKHLKGLFLVDLVVRDLRLTDKNMTMIN